MDMKLLLWNFIWTAYVVEWRDFKSACGCLAPFRLLVTMKDSDTDSEIDVTDVFQWQRYCSVTEGWHLALYEQANQNFPCTENPVGV